MRTVHAQLTSGQAPAPGMPGVATRLLLEGYALADRPETGLALANEALRDRGRGLGRGAELWEAEIRRLRASFLARLGARADEIEAELGRALTGGPASAGARLRGTAMRPFGTGAVYLNFTPEAYWFRDAYGDATYARLVALKDRYDPANLFRLNQNIRPSRSAAELALRVLA